MTRKEDEGHTSTGELDSYMDRLMRSTAAFLNHRDSSMSRAILRKVKLEADMVATNMSARVRSLSHHAAYPVFLLSPS